MKKYEVLVKISFGEDLWTITGNVKRTIHVEAPDEQVAWMKASDIAEEREERKDIISVERVSVKEVVPPTLVAKGVEIIVGVNKVEIDILVNEKGNLVLSGLSDLGPIYYDMLDEELEFTIATDV